MRISSLTYFSSGLAGIQQQQAAIAKLTVQISTGLRVNQPKDDPISASRILQLTDSIALRNQYLSNQLKADLALDQEGTVVAEIRRVLEDTRTLLTASSPSQDQDLREQYSDLISANYLQLSSLVNTIDPAGNYIFSGFETGTEPFIHTQVAPDDDNDPSTHATSAATTYNGTAYPGGLRYIEIDKGRTLQVNDNLDYVMQAGTASDVLQAIDQVAIDMREEPGTLYTQADIDAALTVITAALDRLADIETRIAAAQTELADTQAMVQTLLAQDQNALNTLIDLDDAAAIIELQTRQTTLEAASQAYATIAGMSLFDYI